MVAFLPSRRCGVAAGGLPGWTPSRHRGPGRTAPGQASRLLDGLDPAASSWATARTSWMGRAARSWFGKAGICWLTRIETSWLVEMATEMSWSTVVVQGW